jgi:lipopolysaccharide transport system ATP-binding protein
MFFWLRRRPATAPFTLIHLTHAKAGSSWIYHLLETCFPEWIAPRGRRVAADGDLAKHVFAPGRVYGAMFMNRDQFLAHPELAEAKRFVVLRDLRDTLVSLYFSLKISHPLEPDGRTARERAVLLEKDFEDGMRHLMATQLASVARLHRSWAGSGELVLRYEDLILEAEPKLTDLFLNRLQLPLSERTLRRAIRKHSFETRFRRKLGEEDPASHGRQGAPGNWRKHFTPALTAEFAATYGDALIAAGYERDDAWAHR